MPFGLLEFPGIDSNDKYIADCSAEGCTKKHNILKNDMLLSGDQVMNWLDFLDVLECYENAAECGVCTKCSWCKYYFKTLLAEAWGLTWNSWRTMYGQIFTAVVFNPHDEAYRRRPMTVTPRSRQRVSEAERQKIEGKEQKTLFRLKKKSGKNC